MNTRVRMLATAAAAVVLTTSFATAQESRERDERPDRDAPRQRPVAKIGEKAPNFTLKDADGKEFRLADQQGKIVVLQWISPACPVCRRVASSGLTNEMIADVKAMDPDTVFWAINSTKETEPSVSKAYLAEHKIDVPALSDVNGRVGRRFGAKTTPHLFVIDQKGILRYGGAIDDDPRGGKSDATNYVVNAVGQIVAGDTVAPDTTRPYGCSVKYAAASERPQRGEGRQGRGQGQGQGRRGMRMSEEEMLKAFDFDGDGKLSEAERQAAFEAMWEEMPERLQERLLERYDADADGKIDAEERKKMQADRRNRGRGGRGGGGGTGNDNDN